MFSSWFHVCFFNSCTLLFTLLFFSFSTASLSASSTPEAKTCEKSSSANNNTKVFDKLSKPINGNKSIAEKTSQYIKLLHEILDDNSFLLPEVKNEQKIDSYLIVFSQLLDAILELDSSKTERIENLEILLEKSKIFLRNFQILERAGLGTRKDVLLAENVLLKNEIILEKEKNNLLPNSVSADAENIQKLSLPRIEIAQELVPLTRLRYEAGLGTYEDIRTGVLQSLDAKLELANSTEERIEVFTAMLGKAKSGEQLVQQLVQRLEPVKQTYLGLRRNMLVAKSLRLKMEINLNNQKNKLAKVEKNRLLHQSVVANAEKLQKLSRQRIEIEQKLIELNRLEFHAARTTIENSITGVLQLLDAELELAKSTEERIDVLTRMLVVANQVKRDAQLLEAVGLGSTREVKLAESLRLKIEIELSREKK